MPNENSGYLFDLASIPQSDAPLQLKTADAPIWTENKAQLIQRYLRYFVFITKHGTYLDAFAAPQRPDHAGTSCAAKLVIESEPKWFRNFALFDLDGAGLGYLREIAAKEDPEKRTIAVVEGDCNKALPEYLRTSPIPEREATFCLLDQRTFECDWQTVVEVATHKKSGNKIEIFYLLAQGWLDRSVAALKSPDRVLGKWWGDNSWKQLLDLPSLERGQFLASRFKTSFGYKYSYPFPIYEKEDGVGKVMFWMVHASDHEEAPKLMARAYRNVVSPLEPVEQLRIEFGVPEDAACN